MRRILILGRGGAGKTTFARQLSERLGISVIELDKVFWTPSLTPMHHDDWVLKQTDLCRTADWIMDGDLGKYDVLSARLQHADTIVLLDFPLATCLLRAFRRSRERLDFWVWLVTWRRIERPRITREIQAHAPLAQIVVLKNQLEVNQFLANVPS